MRTFEESGLRISVPEEGSFRFADMPAYRALGGRSVSEMDVGWWDIEKQRIVLMEVKDYSAREWRPDLRAKLVAKGRDCLVMLHAVWRDLGDVARALAGALPERCRSPQKLLMVFVLKMGAAGIPREALGPLKSDVEQHVKAYAEILGIRSLVVLLLDHDKAIEKGFPISPLEP